MAVVSCRLQVAESTHPNPSLKKGRDSSPRESSSSHPLPVSGRGPGGGYLHRDDKASILGFVIGIEKLLWLNAS